MHNSYYTPGPEIPIWDHQNSKTPKTLPELVELNAFHPNPNHPDSNKKKLKKNKKIVLIQSCHTVHLSPTRSLGRLKVLS